MGFSRHVHQIGVRALTSGALAAAAVALPAAAAQARTPAPRAGAGAPVPACTTSQLVSFVTNEEGAAGTIFYTLTFANLGSACALKGYPGVSAVNRSGTQVGQAAARTSGTAVKTITLDAPAAAGDVSEASTTIGIVEVGNFPAGSCKPVTAAGLRIYPPGQTAALAVPLPFGACSTSRQDFLSVRALKKG